MRDTLTIPQGNNLNVRAGELRERHTPSQGKSLSADSTLRTRTDGHEASAAVPTMLAASRPATAIARAIVFSGTGIHKSVPFQVDSSVVTGHHSCDCIGMRSVTRQLLA